MPIPSGEAYDQASRDLRSRVKRGAVIDLRTQLGDLPEVMTEAEVAGYLRVTERQLRRMYYDKKGPKTSVIGGQHRIWKDDLIAWLLADRPQTGLST